MVKNTNLKTETTPSEELTKKGNTSEEILKEKSLLDKIEDKKEEAKALDQATQDLAEENNLPSENDVDVISKGEKFLSGIGYLSFLCILPLVLKPKSDFCQIHGKQGLIFLLIFLISIPIQKIGSLIVGQWFTLFLEFLYLICICGGIFFVIKEKKKIPIIGDVAQKLNW